MSKFNLHAPKGIQLWNHPAYMLRHIDGDTFRAEVDLGHYTKRTETYRLLGSKFGVNAYEINSPDPLVRDLAIRGKQRFIELIPVGAPFFVITAKPIGGVDPKDGFGRFLAQAITHEGINVGDKLFEEGLAPPYSRVR